MGLLTPDEMAMRAKAPFPDYPYSRIERLERELAAERAEVNRLMAEMLSADAYAKEQYAGYEKKLAYAESEYKVRKAEAEWEKKLRIDAKALLAEVLSCDEAKDLPASIVGKCREFGVEKRQAWRSGFLTLPSRILLLLSECGTPMTNGDIHQALGGEAKIATIASTVSRLVAKGMLDRYDHTHVTATTTTKE